MKRHKCTKNYEGVPLVSVTSFGKLKRKLYCLSAPSLFWEFKKFFFWNWQQLWKKMLLFFFSKGVITLAMDIFFPLTKNKSLTDVRTLEGTFKKRAGILIDTYSKNLDFFEEVSSFLIVEKFITKKKSPVYLTWIVIQSSTPCFEVHIRQIFS